MNKIFLGILFILFSFQFARAHGDVHELIDEYTLKIKNNPKDAHLYEMRGFLFYKDEDYKHALKDYKKANSLNPDIKGLDFKIGLVYKAQVKYKKAIKKFSEMLETDSLHVLSIRNRGECFLEIGEYESAIYDFRKVIDISEDLIAQNYVDLAQTYIMIYEIDKAIDTYKEGIETKGRLVVLERALIDLYAENNQTELALQEIDIVMKDMNRKESWLSLKGDIAKEAGMKSEAISFYNQAQVEIKHLPKHIQNTDFVRNLDTHISENLQLLKSD